MLREVMRDLFHLLIFFDFASATVLLVLSAQTKFFRIGEYLDRRGNPLSLRRPLPSEFSKEYYVSYRRSAWLAFAFFIATAIGAFLLWLDMVIFGR
jgi:hypothetical protein